MECFDCRWSWFKTPIHIVAHILYPLWKPKDQPIVMNVEMTDGWLGYIQKVYSIDECEKSCEINLTCIEMAWADLAMNYQNHTLQNVNLSRGEKDMGTMCPYYSY